MRVYINASHLDEVGSVHGRTADGRRNFLRLLALAALLVGCKPTPPASPRAEPSTSPAALAPVPEVARPVAETWGHSLPDDGVWATLEEDGLRIGARRWKRGDPQATLQAWIEGKPLVLTAPGELYLAQASAALAVLDDLGAEVWLAHTDGKRAYRVEPVDAPAFQRWLDEPTPGRLRIIQRADGLELQTSVGKLPGPDPNGPSLPQREGRVDVAGLREALGRLRSRFGKVHGLAVVPSFGTELALVVEVLSGGYSAPNEPFFEPLFLVYPRPGPTPGPPPASR